MPQTVPAKSAKRPQDLLPKGGNPGFGRHILSYTRATGLGININHLLIIAISCAPLSSEGSVRSKYEKKHEKSRPHSGWECSAKAGEASYNCSRTPCTQQGNRVSTPKPQPTTSRRTRIFFFHSQELITKNSKQQRLRMETTVKLYLLINMSNPTVDQPNGWNPLLCSVSWQLVFPTVYEINTPEHAERNSVSLTEMPRRALPFP